MKIGVDVFSLRFNDWTASQHLDYADKIGLNVVHFSDLAPFESLEENYLHHVKAQADQLGLEIEVGMGSICPTSVTFSDEHGTAAEQLSQMIGIAHLFGSNAVRCFLGANADRMTGLAGHMQATIETCRAVRDQALDLGIKIALENHAGDMQGRELKALIEEAGPDYVGACIDSGNPLWVSESPHVNLEHVAPYVAMSHIRDTAVWSHPKGAVAQWVAMGDGNVGIEAWCRRYIEQCPNTNFTLEIITTIPPRVLPFLEVGYWDVYPDTPAAEFAQFLKMVHDGEPYTGPILTAIPSEMPAEYKAALAAQQRLMLEKSVLYCRDVLGVGE